MFRLRLSMRTLTSVAHKENSSWEWNALDFAVLLDELENRSGCLCAFLKWCHDVVKFGLRKNTKSSSQLKLLCCWESRFRSGCHFTSNRLIPAFWFALVSYLSEANWARTESWMWAQDSARQCIMSQPRLMLSRSPMRGTRIMPTSQVVLQWLLIC